MQVLYPIISTLTASAPTRAEGGRYGDLYCAPCCPCASLPFLGSSFPDDVADRAASSTFVCTSISGLELKDRGRLSVCLTV
jgi:hypothetical protein